MRSLDSNEARVFREHAEHSSHVPMIPRLAVLEGTAAWNTEGYIPSSPRVLPQVNSYGKICWGMLFERPGSSARLLLWQEDRDDLPSSNEEVLILRNFASYAERLERNKLMEKKTAEVSAWTRLACLVGIFIFLISTGPYVSARELLFSATGAVVLLAALFMLLVLPHVVARHMLLKRAWASSKTARGIETLRMGALTPHPVR